MLWTSDNTASRTPSGPEMNQKLKQEKPLDSDMVNKATDTKITVTSAEVPQWEGTQEVLHKEGTEPLLHTGDKVPVRVEQRPKGCPTSGVTKGSLVKGAKIRVKTNGVRLSKTGDSQQKGVIESGPRKVANLETKNQVVGNSLRDPTDRTSGRTVLWAANDDRDRDKATGPKKRKHRKRQKGTRRK